MMQNLGKKISWNLFQPMQVFFCQSQIQQLCGEAYSVWKEWRVIKSRCPGVSCAPLGLIISSWHPMFYMGSCCPGNNSSHLSLEHHFIWACQFVQYTQVGPKRLFQCALQLDIQISFIPIECYLCKSNFYYIQYWNVSKPLHLCFMSQRELIYNIGSQPLEVFTNHCL